MKRSKLLAFGVGLAVAAFEKAADGNALRVIYRTALDKLGDPAAALKMTGQAMVESGGRTGAVSRAGARGPFQFMPPTARAVGLKDPRDPVASTHAAIQYMDKLKGQYNNPWLALAAYNAGTGNVSRSLKSGPNWLQHLPAETRAYPAKVHAAYQQLSTNGFLHAELPVYGKDTAAWWRYRKAFPSGDVSDRLEASRKAYYDLMKQRLKM